MYIWNYLGYFLHRTLTEYQIAKMLLLVNVTMLLLLSLLWVVQIIFLTSDLVHIFHQGWADCTDTVSVSHQIGYCGGGIFISYTLYL